MITFFSGVMFGGKSAALIERIEEANENGLRYLKLKPELDTRDGLFITSRDYSLKYKAEPADNDAIVKIFDGDYDFAFLDEVQFCEVEWLKKIITLCELSRTELVVSGLVTDFKQEPFPASEFLLHQADKIVFHYAKCCDCNKCLADRNVIIDEANELVLDGETFQAGNHFKVICTECYIRRTRKFV